MTNSADVFVISLSGVGASFDEQDQELPNARTNPEIPTLTLGISKLKIAAQSHGLAVVVLVVVVVGRSSI